MKRYGVIVSCGNRRGLLLPDLDGVDTTASSPACPSTLSRKSPCAVSGPGALVGYEYVRDCAALVHERGLVNVLVTNGTIEENPWQELLPLIDAANIDLKGFTPQWYHRLGGNLDTMKRSITLAAERCHVEVTTLLVPGENDSVEEVRALARWLASVNRDIPLHLSRFFPRYQMQDRPPTPVEQVYPALRTRPGTGWPTSTLGTADK